MTSTKLKTQDNTFKEMMIYQTPDSNVKVEIYLKDENLWLTQKLIAKLFDCSIDNISLHFKNIFKEKELQESAVVEEFSITVKKERFFAYISTPFLQKNIFKLPLN